MIWDALRGALVTRGLGLAADLRVAQALAAGPQSSEELARERGADPDVLYRVLRALASDGIFEDDAIESLIARGIQTVVAPDADRRKQPRPGRRGGLYDFTRRVLLTDHGKQLYLKRQGMIEPVFGQIKSNRGANRFLRRGRSAVRSEWRLLAATHNLIKLHRHQLAAA